MISRLPHPVQLMRRAGLSELPAAAVILTVITLQYVFLARLWIGYLVEKIEDVIAVEVVVTASVFAVVGAVVIGGASATRWIKAARAARKLEKDANNASFDDIRQVITQMIPGSGLLSPPRLRYTPKNALALETRQGLRGGEPAVVVGLAQRAVARDRPTSLLRRSATRSRISNSAERESRLRSAAQSPCIS